VLTSKILLGSIHGIQLNVISTEAGIHGGELWICLIPLKNPKYLAELEKNQAIRDNPEKPVDKRALIG
jgi:hypothetical protein